MSGTHSSLPILGEDSHTHSLMIGSMAVARASNSLPVGADHAYHCASTQGFSEQALEAQEDLQYLLDRIAHFVQPTAPGDTSDTETDTKASPRIRTYADVQALIEGLLETADLKMDQAAGADMAHTSTAVTAAAEQKARTGANSAKVLLESATLPRPQLQFHAGDAADNDRNTPFVPKIRSKPHSRQVSVCVTISTPLFLSLLYLR